MIIPKKYRKASGIFVDKKSIGTAWIYGTPYTYNADKVYTNKIDFNEVANSTKKKKKVIFVKRK